MTRSSIDSAFFNGACVVMLHRHSAAAGTCLGAALHATTIYRPAYGVSRHQTHAPLQVDVLDISERVLSAAQPSAPCDNAPVIVLP